MLLCTSNVAQGVRGMNGIGIYEKTMLQRAEACKTGSARIPDPARQAQVDLTARILRTLLLNDRGANQPLPRDMRGILCDAYG